MKGSIGNRILELILFAIIAYILINHNEALYQGIEAIANYSKSSLREVKNISNTSNDLGVQIVVTPTPDPFAGLYIDTSGATQQAYMPDDGYYQSMIHLPADEVAPNVYLSQASSKYSWTNKNILSDLAKFVGITGSHRKVIIVIGAPLPYKYQDSSGLTYDGDGINPILVVTPHHIDNSATWASLFHEFFHVRHHIKGTPPQSESEIEEYVSVLICAECKSDSACYDRCLQYKNNAHIEAGKGEYASYRIDEPRRLKLLLDLINIGSPMIPIH